jgi:hypothetical protein
LATWGPENFSFANLRRFFTSSFDHAANTRRFAFAIDAILFLQTHIIPALELKSAHFHSGIGSPRARGGRQYRLNIDALGA